MPYANKEDRNAYLKQKRLIAKQNALEKNKDEDEYETYDDIIVKPTQKSTDTGTQKTTDTGTQKTTDTGAQPKYRFY